MVVRLKSAEFWSNEYAQRRPIYVSFVERTERLLRDLLHERGLDVIQTSGRAKDVGSFLEKIRSKASKYSNPLLEVTDLAGLRIITYYQEDVDAVQTILESEFDVDWTQSVDKGAQLDPDRFGYLSRHFVIRLRPPRAHLSEWAPFANLCAEVQVRTALQHAWAAVSHKLDYKTEVEVPLVLKRRLNRLSALFEIADDEFSSFTKASSDVSSAYQGRVGRGDLDLQLDLDSLDSYLDSRVERLDELSDLAPRGWRITKVPHARRQHDRRNLLQIARAVGMRTIADLDQFLSQDSATLANVMQAIDTVTEAHAVGVDYASIEDALTQVMWMQHPVADEEGRLIYEGVDPTWINEVRTAIGGVRFPSDPVDRE